MNDGHMNCRTLTDILCYATKKLCLELKLGERLWFWLNVNKHSLSCGSG